MEKELNKKMKDNNYDIAMSNHQDVVMDNEITRSTSGFTGTELPRESSVEYKTFPSLTMGRTHRSVRLDVVIAAPQNLEMAHA
tara:strand:- start:64 stop:312 length:249 start_codon:yes stop_codon:yes gene_type:complete